MMYFVIRQIYMHAPLALNLSSFDQGDEQMDMGDVHELENTVKEV